MKNILIIISCFFTLTIMAQLEPVKTGVYKWVDHPVKVSKDRESRKILEGISPYFEYLEIHATTQYPGAKPSTAHANEAIEECIIVKEGLMKVTLEGESTVLGVGGVFLLMPKQMHSLKNIGDTNLTYYVMRYKSKKKMNIERGETSGGSLLLNPLNLISVSNSRGARRAYFDRPTAMCERFEMHMTRLDSKGLSHDPHEHVETEMILVLSGETGMMIEGENYTGIAGDFYFTPSQLFHGVSNASDKPCSYLVLKWN